jgi:hypothetical protein
MKTKKTVQDWLKDQNFKDAVESIFPFGLTSASIIEFRAGVDKRQAIYLVTKLQQLRVLHPLSTARVIATRQGRPELPYGLSPRAAQELRDLGYKDAAWLDLDGPLDVAHRFCMALAASQTDWPIAMEKVIPYAPGHNLRADLLITDPEGLSRILEIEQALDDKRRAISKLRALGELFATNPPKLAREVMLVFNLIDKDLPRTLRVWQTALRDVGEIPLAVHYSCLANFVYSASYAEWETFPRLTPSDRKRIRSDPEAADEKLLGEPRRNEVPMAELVEQIQADIPIKLNDEASMRLYHFGALALAIHRLDFGENGNTSVYAEYPANSLSALSEFLHNPSQNCLLDLLQHEMKIFRKQNGVTMLRHASTRLAWNFLRYFGFGRGGPLILFVRVPEMGDNTSEIRFEVLFQSRSNDKRLVPPNPEDKCMQAISWLLSALITYPEELGLVKEK